MIIVTINIANDNHYHLNKKRYLTAKSESKEVGARGLSQFRDQKKVVSGFRFYTKAQNT